MSYLSRMYGRRGPQTKPAIEKNPNRVLGGLKGQGVNSFTMLGEDGVEKQIPTQAYVQALEEKLKLQDSRLSVLEKQLRRLNNDQRNNREAIKTTFNR